MANHEPTSATVLELLNDLGIFYQYLSSKLSHQLRSDNSFIGQ